jgi:large subunit ribosomal protein L25
MSKFQKLEVQERNETGTSAVRRLRKNNNIPGVIYHSGEQGVSVSIEKITLNQAVKSGQAIFETSLGEKPQFVLLKDVQYHPVTDEIMHVDLQQVTENQKITLDVPLKPIGESVGVKSGGILVQLMNSLSIRCRPVAIPEFLEIDITELETGNSLFVRDVIRIEGLELVTSEDVAVFSVQEPKQEKEEVVEAAEDDMDTTDSSEANLEEQGDSTEQTESGDEENTGDIEG